MKADPKKMATKLREIAEATPGWLRMDDAFMSSLGDEDWLMLAAEQEILEERSRACKNQAWYREVRALMHLDPCLHQEACYEVTSCESASR